MTKDKRDFSGSIGVRFDTSRYKLELSDAQLYGGPPGCVRVRIDRRWHDAPDGAHLYFDREQLGALVATLALGEVPALEPLPNLRRGAHVYVTYDNKGDPDSCLTHTSTPPIRGHDGRVYVGVMTMSAGFMFLPLENVTVIETARQRRRLAEKLNARAEQLLGMGA